MPKTSLHFLERYQSEQLYYPQRRMVTPIRHILKSTREMDTQRQGHPANSPSHTIKTTGDTQQPPSGIFSTPTWMEHTSLP